MASINFNAFEGWFRKPPTHSHPSTSSPSPTPSPPKPQPTSPPSASPTPSNPPKTPDPKPEPDPEKPGHYTQMLEQFFWECENLPDYRHTPEVEKILNSDPILEKKENPTEEEIRENEKFWKEFRASPVTRFLIRAEQIADKINEMELKENDRPYKSEDRKLWQAVPHVIGPDGRPMPRKAIKTKKESGDKFWDFARQFFFGLWGFQQRPYLPGRPFDAAQAIGYKRLEKRYYDFRLGATATTKRLGILSWVPIKGFEDKTYEQLQEEAIES